MTTIDWPHLIYAVVLFIVGFILAKQVSVLAEKTISKRFSHHHGLLVRRLVFYGVLFVFILCALQQLGFKLSALLGAAGVFTVALGFASQTAASNLISGIFLIFERPFKIGDVIKVKGLEGRVSSIDLLSTHITTSDNALIRIPNETLMKSEIMNTSFYTTRRRELRITISDHHEVGEVRLILLQIANEEEAVLQEPMPEVFIERYGEALVQLKLQFWAENGRAAQTTKKLLEEVKLRLEEDNIKNPAVHMVSGD